jgi:hypothetical protein
MELIDLASNLVSHLGPRYFARRGYRFAVPTGGGTEEIVADAAVFSSPVPSIHTASIGFTTLHGGASTLSPAFAYLGAPVFVGRTQDSVSIFHFKGSPVPEKVAELSVSQPNQEEWLRNEVLGPGSTIQPSLFAGDRGLLLEETCGALSSRIKSLIELVGQEQQFGAADSFRIAIRVLRRLSLNSNGYPKMARGLSDYADSLAAKLEGTISFENVPPEAVAELYETFAVHSDFRRSKGVVYTPAWLASYLISRLPADAFRTGRATDPTCGSGTFLVCFVKRLIEELVSHGLPVTSEVLSAAIAGYDIDPVAIEAARLSLDFLCRAIGLPAPDWTLAVRDATARDIDGDWIIGNLPFGYRTHEGRNDLSSRILEAVNQPRHVRKGIALILPDSLAYTSTAETARSLLRTNYDIQEITRLPEEVFATSSVQTMIVVARAGKSGRETLVREVSREDIPAFRAGVYSSRTYVSRFSDSAKDPWRFSPFNNVFEIAELGALQLSALAEPHLGLQIYGADPRVISTRPQSDGQPILLEMNTFAAWSPNSARSLPHVVGHRNEVRRPGPWDSFVLPKVILRTTTVPGARDRLAAIPDTQGVWFVDKFVGLWPTSQFNITALAAYLQTRFVAIWFDSNNPSRKLRVSILSRLPFPRLPDSWWERASRLATVNTVLWPSNHVVSPTLFDPAGESGTSEWEWFNSAVETALHIDVTSRAEMARWLRDPKRRDD